MKKSDLKNGMIVKTNGDDYGVVIIKDSTNENCIKFLYCPRYLVDNGCLLNSNFGIVHPLDELDDNLNFYHIVTENDLEHFIDSKVGDKIILGQIIEVFDLNRIWIRNNLQPTPSGLMGDCE